MKKFVVLCGPGRSGTSLGMQLVKACGFNVGECNEPNIPHRWEGLRAGYNEHPLSNAQGAAIDDAIRGLEAQGCNAIKLIHLYAQWIPKLKEHGYDVHVVVTSRAEEEIWDSGRQLYTGWQPQAIGAICGTAKRILRETQGYLEDPNIKAFELPFQKIVEKDRKTLLGLAKFLMEEKEYFPELGRMMRTNGAEIWDAYVRMLEIIRPDIVKHAKVKDEG